MIWQGMTHRTLSVQPSVSQPWLWQVHATVGDAYVVSNCQVDRCLSDVSREGPVAYAFHGLLVLFPCEIPLARIRRRRVGGFGTPRVDWSKSVCAVFTNPVVILITSHPHPQAALHGGTHGAVRPGGADAARAVLQQGARYHGEGRGARPVGPRPHKGVCSTSTVTRVSFIPLECSNGKPQ